MMKRAILLLLATVAISGFWQAIALAERVPKERLKEMQEAREKNEQSATLKGELAVVRRLMRAGSYDHAASYLESLLTKYPDDWQIMNTLQDCYFQGKMFDKLLLFLQRRLEEDEQNFQVLRDLGRTWLQKGQPDSATDYFYKAVTSSGNDASAVAFLASLYSQLGYHSEAVQFIDSLRSLTGKPHMAPLEMGDALSALKKYSPAADEYLVAMNADTAAERDASVKLRELVQYPESSDDVMRTLQSYLKGDSADKKLSRLYGEFLLDKEKYDEAFVYFLNLDDSAAQKGNELHYFMSACADRKKYAPVIRAGERFRSRFPMSPLLQVTQFMLAEAYTKEGQYHDALDTYERIAGMSVNERDLAEINLKMGLIYKDNMRDFDRAWQHLAMVKNIYPSGPAAEVATLEQGEILIYQREFDSALTIFTKLDSLKQMPDELAEAISYAIAEIKLFQKKFEEASGRLKGIIARYPRGFFVNDAVNLTLVIDETLQEAPDKIGLLASVEYFDYVDNDDSLEFYLQKITEDKIETLAPVSYLRLARLYYKQGRFKETLSSVEKLTQEYAESYFLPFGLKIKADVLIKSSETKEAAVKIYQDLLEKYPTYPFSAEIRDILRKELPVS
jgi:tetratricopeptide (TPR) repeat protein